MQRIERNAFNGSIVSRTKIWKNRRLANFRARDSKYSLTTRCWQYHNSRGGVREMSLRTKTILPGVRKGSFVTWSAGCRSYFFSSRKPANVNVQKHAKRARVCIFKYKWKAQSATHSISIQWVNIMIYIWSQICLCLLLYLKHSESPVYIITNLTHVIISRKVLGRYFKNDWYQIGTPDWH